jgi:EmrB/QacA subfamily drug resistance transporter
MSHQNNTQRLDRDVLVLGAVVVLGTITAILDATIVNVAIPTLRHAFDAPVASIQWVMTGYLLAFASVIPLTGWASGHFGAKRVWLAALLVFMAGSVFAGVATSLPELIAFRVLQGIGGGLLMPVGQTVLAQTAGPQRMGRVMSVIGVPMLLAPVFGPVIGGAIVDQVSWRWIFFVNLPIGALALALAWRLMPETPAHNGRLDLRGLLLLSPGLAIFVYGMSEAGTSGGFGGSRALAGIAVGVALVAAFVWHARRRGQAALIDVALFKSRGFAAAAGTNLLVGIALFGALILLPLYLQTVRGESPLATGLLLMPQGIGAALAMPFAGRLTDTIGARVVVPAGVLLALAGTAAYTQVGADTSYVLLSIALFVIGLGLGSTIIPSMAVAYRTVSREAVPQATSAINVIQRVAGSVGTALLAVVLQRNLRVEGAEPAHAFAAAFWVAFGLVATALVPALLLPRLKHDGAGEEHDERGDLHDGGDAGAERDGEEGRRSGGGPRPETPDLQLAPIQDVAR